MIRFITSAPGKTREAAVREVFAGIPGAAGFCSRKIETEDGDTGYDLVDLADGTSLPLARRADNLPPWWDEELQHGKFSFSAAAFRRASKIIDSALDNKAAAVFLDEIGKLELKGEGYAGLLRRCLRTGTDICIGCRKINIGALKKEFGIQSPHN